MKQVLVVDSDMPMRCALQNMLEKNYDVICMSDGMEACDWLSDGNFPDLIISNVRMPLMDGLEFLKDIRASRWHKNIPVVILSALFDDQTKTRCLNEGAVAYLNKFYELHSLIKVMSRPSVSEKFSLRKSIQALHIKLNAVQKNKSEFSSTLNDECNDANISFQQSAR